MTLPHTSLIELGRVSKADFYGLTGMSRTAIEVPESRPRLSYQRLQFSSSFSCTLEWASGLTGMNETGGSPIKR